MSQCVPILDVDNDGPLSAAAVGRPSLRFPVNSAATDIPLLDYEVAELAWENGQLVMHSLGQPRVMTKSQAASSSASPWDKPRASGTLESIVNQATRFQNPNKPAGLDSELVPWVDNHRVSSASTASTAGVSASVTMDALVPCSNVRSDHHQEEQLQVQSTPVVGSCNGLVPGMRQGDQDENLLTVKRARVAARGPVEEWSSACGSGTTFGRNDSRRVTATDTCEMDLGTGFTSTSNGSPENTTSSGRPCTKTTTGDDHDSVCHSRSQRDVGDEEDKKGVAGKSSVSTKRSRAAAVHNQSERKRRDKINQRMKALQKLVPNSNKTDKASMLDEVIEYLKQLQAQVNMMSRFNLPPMMLPMAMQQQLQMSMMANPMGLGMGTGMVGLGFMDMNSMNRSATNASMNTNTTAASNIAQNMMGNPFMPMVPQSWDGGSNEVWNQLSMMRDPMAAFLSCSPQPMTMDAYSRMAALYQQMLQQLPQPPNS